MGFLCMQLWSVPLCLEPALAAPEYSEDVVKAAYLYRFAGYVEWPGRADAAFVIAVVDDQVRPLLSDFAAGATLVVTDEDGGLDEGATLNLLTLDHRVRFEVSLIAAARSHLKISAELLAVAVRVFGSARQERPPS
jgi:hypothetical protein